MVEPVAPDGWARERRDVDRGNPIAGTSTPRCCRGSLPPGRSSRTGRAVCRDRGLRAHAQPRADRLLRAARLLLGRERLDAVRAGVRRPAGGAAGDRLLPRAGQAGRGRLPRLPLRARAGPGGVRLRLELRLLPARLPPARAGNDRLPAARRPLRQMLAGEPSAERGYPGWTMATCTDTDRAHLARAIELAAQRPGHGQAQPGGGRRRRPRRRGARRGLARSSSAALHAEVNAIEACGAGRSERGDASTCRSSRAATRARRRPAPRRSCRPASGAWSSPPTTPPRRPRVAAWGSCATRAWRCVLADGELAARARLLNQAFRKHARVGRPWVLFKSAMTLDGKVATRTGDSQVDLRRGQPRARPSLAGLRRRGGRRHRHGAGR